MKRIVLAFMVVLPLGDFAMNDTRVLHAAKRAKKDEFYTQRVDIENELRHYKAHFNGKVVLCNILPWSKGGKTVLENLQMLCRRDNALKSDKW